jgi:hypothetical protein
VAELNPNIRIKVHSCYRFSRNIEVVERHPYFICNVFFLSIMGISYLDGGMNMEWNYYDTFIKVAGDCPAESGLVPPEKKNGRTKPGIEYDLVADQPYVYTQEELLYETHIRHKNIPQEELDARGTQLRDEFFQKPKACMRASMLPKKYGWGIHFNSEGRMALVPIESPDYKRFAEGDNGSLKVVAAMRSSRG